MRVILSTMPGFGHLLPLLPLGRALHRLGHQVAVLSSAGMAPLVAAEGFELLAAGPMPDALLAEVAERTGADPAADPEPAAVAELFAGTRVDLTVDEAAPIAADWQPDLIVNEFCDFVGPLIGTALRVPVATLAWGPALPPPFLDAMTALVRPRYTERGLLAPSATPSGRWLLDTCPPGFQGARSATATNIQRLALRPEPHQAAGHEGRAGYAGQDLAGVSDRPMVLVSFGTLFADPAVVGPILRSLSTLDIDLVATLGLDGKADELAVDADRITLVPFQPLAELLTGVSVVVCHGGAGTTLGALARGIPMVVVPQGADQFIQAERVAATGAGLALPPGQADPAQVTDAVRRLLDEPMFAATAARIRDEIAAMPTPAEVAGVLTAALTA
jgi:UDP:flavonoid glycosyltransferase YjiC (YdhE family)